MKKLSLRCNSSSGIWMSGCSSEPSKPATAEKPQPKAPETITGSSAFFKCYVSARGWAGDAQPYRVESHASADFKGQDGKAEEWRVGFASPSQHAAQALYLGKRRYFSRRRRHLQPDEFQHPDFQRPVSQGGYGQSLCRRPAARRRQLLEKEPDTPGSVCAGLEPAEQPAPVARDLWNESRDRQAAGGRERIHRGVFAGGEVGAIAPWFQATAVARLCPSTSATGAGQPRAARHYANVHRAFASRSSEACASLANGPSGRIFRYCS